MSLVSPQSNPISPTPHESSYNSSHPPPPHPPPGNSSPQYNARVNAVFNKDSSQTSNFVYIVKPSNTYCRPDCEVTKLLDPSLLLFFDSSKDASANGFKPCNECKPDLEMKVDNKVIDSTVSTVNASLGLDLSQPTATQQQQQQQQPIQLQLQVQDITRPIDQSDSVYMIPADQTSTPEFSPNTRHFRSFSSVGNQDFIIPTVDKEGWRPRRASIASGHIPAVLAAVTEMTKTGQIIPNSAILTTQSTPITHGRRRDRADGERDHHRLVDEACRHIAAAAAASAAVAAAAAAANSDDESTTPASRSRSRKGRNSESRSGSNSVCGASTQSIRLQRKKRRGGILGFKELAAKAGLSPWHFHRVFRSVTGLTPKAYGEACWNAVTANPTVPAGIVANNKINEEDDNDNNTNNSFNSPQFNSFDNQFHSTMSEPGDTNTPSLFSFDSMGRSNHPNHEQIDPIDPLGIPNGMTNGQGQYLIPTTTTNGSPIFNTVTSNTPDPGPFVPNSWEGMMPMGFAQDSPSLGGTGSTPATVQNTPHSAYHPINQQQPLQSQQGEPLAQLQSFSATSFMDEDQLIIPHPVGSTTTPTPLPLIPNQPPQIGLTPPFSDLSMHELLTTIESTPSILAPAPSDITMDIQQFPVITSGQELESIVPPPSLHDTTTWMVDTPTFTSENEHTLLKNDTTTNQLRDWVYVGQPTS